MQMYFLFHEASIGSSCVAPSNWKACANLPLTTCQHGKCSCSGGSVKHGHMCVCGKGKTLNAAKDGCEPAGRYDHCNN